MPHPLRCLPAIFIAVVALPTASAGSKDKPQKPVVINGELSDKDSKDTKLKASRAHVHTEPLRQGVLYVIDLVSKDFDAYLRLEDPQGKPIAEDDDGGGGTSARLFFIPPTTGDYRIIATAAQPKNGKYRLTVQEAHLPSSALPLTDNAATVKGTVAVNSPRSPLSPHNSCQLYRALLKAGTAYQIDLASSDFDAFLVLADARMVRIADDDDSGGKRDARIRFKCEHDGTYYIIASGLNNPVGAFELKIGPIMSP